MDAIISGRAGVAFLVDGEVLSSFDVEDPNTLLPRRPADLRLIFGEAPDIELFEDVDHAEASRQLERAFNCSSSLDLALILLAQVDRRQPHCSSECIPAGEFGENRGPIN